MPPRLADWCPPLGLNLRANPNIQFLWHKTHSKTSVKNTPAIKAPKSQPLRILIWKYKTANALFSWGRPDVVNPPLCG